MREKILDHYNVLTGFSYRLSKNREDAEDLIQDTICTALTNQDKFKEGTNLRGWLCTIMHNIFVNKYRRKRFLDTENEMALLNHSVNPSAETIIELKHVMSAIDHLPCRIQRSLSMFVKGYNYQEISEVEGKPQATIRNRVFLGRQILKTQFKQ